MKKVLALVLAVVLVMGMSTVAFAKDAPDYSYSIGYSYRDGQDIAYQFDSRSEDVKPDSNIELAIFAHGDVSGAYNGVTVLPLTDSKGVTYNYSLVPKAVIKDDKIDVKVRATEGSKALKKVSIKYKDTKSGGYAYIKVEFVEYFVSTSELDYNFIVYLTKNKNRMTDTEFTLSGEIANEKQYVDENDDYVYTDDVPVVEAEGYVKNIQVEVGQGLSIYTKMFEDRKYYAQVTQDVKSEDDEVLAQYPTIDTIFYLSTIGLNSASNYVEIDISERMYVYNADLEYIGTTNDKLPYSTKYYVSTTQLDVDDADDLGDEDDFPDDENPNMGGDDIADNINDNPGTGK